MSKISSGLRVRALIARPPITLGILVFVVGVLPEAAYSQCELSVDLILSSDGSSADAAGTSVAVAQDVFVVGAPGDDDSGSNSGAAYVWRLKESGWIEEQKLVASDGTADDQFGRTVAISEDVVIVGAFGNGDGGAAYVFRFNGLSWVQEAKLVPADSVSGDSFGFAVSLSGDVALIGAYGADDLGTNSGAAYVFRFDGAAWVEEYKLLASDGEAYDFFGAAVALSGDAALVGAYLDDDVASSGGAAYVFRFGGSLWTQEQKLWASDGATDDRFGAALAISGDALIVGVKQDDDKGANSGSAYIFAFNGATWVEESKLLPSDGLEQDKFGVAVGLSGDVAVVGSYWHEHSGITDAGAAYLYRFDGSDWVEDEKLVAPDAWYWDYFGASVAVAGDLAVVGAVQDDNKGNNSGSGYAFSKVCPDNGCISDGDCDDGDACTTDRCSGRACTHTEINCSDGIACTADTCWEGQCVNDATACECVTDADCNDGVRCSVDTCVNNVCINDVGACDCFANADCADELACTVDFCAGGTCYHDASACECATAGDCYDGLACSVASCLDRECIFDTSECECFSDGECDDRNSCTSDTCSGENVCVHELVAGCCGNGVCDGREDSCECPVDCKAVSTASCGNGVCETSDGEDCLTCPEDCNGLQGGLVRERFCCGAGGGENPVGCDDARCFEAGVSCTSDPSIEPCCGDGLCTGFETGCNCPEDCGTPALGEIRGATCNDGLDNDCDKLVDCDDPDCMKDAVCRMCDGDGVCESGEDCYNCPSDCAGLSFGLRIKRFCCGNGVLERPERKPGLCDGNP